MDIEGLTTQTVSDESLADAVQFTADFAPQLQRYVGRLTGSDGETACARQIRSRLERETDIPVRMEAFKARPSLGRGSFYMLGLWFILSYALYFISFAGGKTAGILLTLVALLNFLVGGTVIMFMFFGGRRVSRLLRESVSYNVVSEYSKNRDRDVRERVIVIADNHDAQPGSALRDYGLLRKLTVWICPISAAIFILFCIVKMAVGTSAPSASAKITLLTVIPSVAGVCGTVVTLLHYSPLPRHAKVPNGVSTCVAMATYAYFAEQPELLPDDVRIVYASFGAENSAHCGEEAFLKAHPEYAEGCVLCFGDVTGAQFKLADYDPIRRKGCSTILTSALSGAAHDLDESLSVLPHATISQKISQLHGCASTVFWANGVQSATLLTEGERLDDDVIKRLFLLSVNSVFRLFKDIPVRKADSQSPSSPSADAQMRPISSK